MKNELLTITEAAEILGVERVTVWRYVKAGHFPNAQKSENKAPLPGWYIPLSDIKAFQGAEHRDYLTTREAAERWGWPIHQVRIACRDGAIPGAYREQRPDGTTHQWRIDKEAIGETD